ncbi:MAG: single-stranded-DNA-specific exonuclease RecJ [Clostridia bacterium]|nr:single-stranded-DNA-specific exonuclease RecJ [Clostridia bacterium]
MLQFQPKKKEKTEIPEELKSLGVEKRLLELLVERGINTQRRIHAYLHPRKEDLYDPMLMQDMDRAVSVIRDAIAKKEEIVVFGDYDVDGVTATAILMTYLRKQGATVTSYIPDRHGEGYGLNVAAVEKIASHAKLLITVDCGITCPNEVRRARELGMRVIVTDHHQLGPQLPECEAVLNPILGSYPFRKLCGAGVAFKLVQAMGGMEAIEPLWELAAMATIADIVPLIDENRVIVTYGLRAMAVTKRPGLLALMSSAGVEAEKVTASDVAYRMAPRINAGGRLALASRGVELLTTRSAEKAALIASDLDSDNTKRRELELEIFKQADEMTRSEIDFRHERAIVICGEGWNPGVIGLASSRLVEKYKWPTVLLSQDGELCVGSARSIPGVDIHKAMATCRDLFVRFGGHAQAAGLTIEKKNVTEFRRRLTQAILEQTEPEVFIPTEEYDLELELHEMTEELVQAFAAMQPTGFGNPAPVFCVRGVNTTDVKQIGKDGAHLRFRMSHGTEMRSAIAFRMGDRAAAMPEIIDAVLSLSINEWNNKRSVQCEVRQFQAYTPAKAFLKECQGRNEEIHCALFGAMRMQRPAVVGNTERVTLQQAEGILRNELLTGYQGTLLCVHTVPVLQMANIHLAILHAQLDYALRELDDVRMFNTLVMAPDWEKLNCQPKAIVMLDGFMSDGERSEAIARFPQARIIEVDGFERQKASAAAALIAGDDALRRLYKAMRQREKTEYSMEILAAEAGVEAGMALCGMHIFEELGLIEYTRSPLHYRICPSSKVSLEASRIRTALLRMKG